MAPPKRPQVPWKTYRRTPKTKRQRRDHHRTLKCAEVPTDAERTPLKWRRKRYDRWDDTRCRRQDIGDMKRAALTRGLGRPTRRSLKADRRSQKRPEEKDRMRHLHRDCARAGPVHSSIYRCHSPEEF